MEDHIAFRTIGNYLNSHYDDILVVVFGTFLVHEVFWLIFNIFYLIIDDYSLLQYYRLQKDKPTVASSVRWKYFFKLIKGHVTELLPINAIAYPLFSWFGVSSTIPLPTWQTFLVQFLVFNIIEDFGFYWVHRWLHTPLMYKKIHYIHHEYTVPFSMVGEIAHPVEFLLNFLIPLMSGPFLMGLVQGVHIYTFWAWIIYRAMRSSDSHCGYYIPWHPLRLIAFVYGGAKYHDFHHMFAGRNNNYGSYKVWDYLMGTDTKFREYYKKGK